AITLRALVAFGGIVGAASAVPILFIRDVAVPVAASPHVGRLLRRFAAVEIVFGLGAGSFIPFTNLFFADRFALPFGPIGFALGAIGVAVGPAGFTVNIVVLVICYALGATLVLALFSGRVPQGDSVAVAWPSTAD